MDEKSLKPAFLMLFHCENALSKVQHAPSKNTQWQHEHEHAGLAIKWLQKVYGEKAGISELPECNALGLGVATPAVAITSIGPPPPVATAPRNTALAITPIPTAPLCIRKLQDELAQLRAANLGLADEVSTVRAAKRLLEEDMESERIVRRRLEDRLVREGDQVRRTRVLLDKERKEREEAEFRVERESQLRKEAVMDLRRGKSGPWGSF